MSRKSCPIFRPHNHPLKNVTKCPHCRHRTVSLPGYPGDYFDCENCGHSWAPTRSQVKRMWRNHS